MRFAFICTPTGSGLKDLFVDGPKKLRLLHRIELTHIQTCGWKVADTARLSRGRRNHTFFLLVPINPKAQCVVIEICRGRARRISRPECRKFRRLSDWSKQGAFKEQVELTGSGGHIILWEKGVHNREDTPRISAGVSPADNRTEPIDAGHHVGRKRVARLLKAAGLEGASRRKRARTTVRDRDARRCPGGPLFRFSGAGSGRSKPPVEASGRTLGRLPLEG